MNSNKNNTLLLIVSILLSLAVATASAAPPLPGAIFTTDAEGTIVNGNTKYGAKCGEFGVWLDGGPGPNAPQTAAGLPDGDYGNRARTEDAKIKTSRRARRDVRELVGKS